MCKLRVEKAVESYKEYLAIKELYGVPTDLFGDGWEARLDELDDRFKSYAVCGRDDGGRTVM